MDITGDITKDIVRKRKIQLFQAIKPASHAPEHDLDDEVVMGKAHKRCKEEGLKTCKVEGADAFLPSPRELPDVPREGAWTVR